MPSLGVTFTGDTKQLDAAYQRAAAGARAAEQAMKRQSLGGPNSASAMIANEKKLAAEKISIAEKADLQILAANRAAGAQLTLSESLRLKKAGLEYRSLAAVAAETESKKVASHAAALAAQKAMDGNAVKAQIAMTSGALEWNLIASEKAAAEQAAASKAELLASAAISARGFGGGRGLLGHHDGGGSSRAGVIQEVAVIGHEIMQGRGGGRILGSISILGQRLGWLRKIVKTTADADIDAAMSMGKVEQAAGLAAIKTEAQAVASAEAAGATSALAVADRVAADAAAKDYASIKMQTAAMVEQAEISKATATIKPGSLMGIGMVIAIVVAALITLYKVYHTVTRALELKNEGTKEALELSRAYNLSVIEELGAQEKLADALLKTKSALEKLNEEKDDFLKNTQEAVSAMKDEADAQANLADIQTKSQLLAIDLDEKTGKITHESALQKKAQIEINAMADKSEAKSETLHDTARLLAQKSDTSTLRSAEAQAAALQASQDLNSSPGGVSRAVELADAEKAKKAAESSADEYHKKADDLERYSIMHPKGGANADEIASYNKRAAESEEFAKFESQAIAVMKSNMAPSENAAAETMRKAEEAKSTAATLKSDAEKAKAQADSFDKNNPAQLDAEQALRMKQLALDAASPKFHATADLSSNQKIGAYAMQMNSPMVMIAKTHLTEAKNQTKLLQTIALNLAKNGGNLASAMAEAINGPFH